MKKNILKYTALVFGLLAFTSCEDMLDRPPLDQIGSDQYWKTTSDLEKYVTQFYEIFPTYYNPKESGIFAADAYYGSDDVIMNEVNETLNGARPVTNGAGGSNWNWSKIRSVNIFFDNYRKCNDAFGLWSQYLGEAHFFRAYLYFDKVKAFGDVPWYNKSLNMNDEDLYKARDPRTLVVDSIISDLDKAIEYCKPIKDVKGGTNRISKEVALIFKSRVALNEGTWQKYHAGTPFATEGADPNKYFRIAVDAAEELMNGGYSVGLYGNSPEKYGEMFGLDDMSNCKEVLLWKKYDKALGLAHDSQVYVTTRTNSRSVTMEFVESFLSKDGAPIDYHEVAKENKGTDFLNYLKEHSDPRLAQTIWTPGDLMWDNSNGKTFFTLPYIGQSGEFINTTGFQVRKGVNPYSPGAGGFWGGDCVTGHIIFRYAEALLNYAEAKCELGETVDYDKSINLLRQRAGMPNFKVQKDVNAKRFSDYGYDITDELFEIRRERRVELGCEGFRHNDYKRWAAHSLFKGKRPTGYPVQPSEFAAGTHIPAVNAEGLLDPFVSEIPNGYQFNAERDYLQCVPINEITLNPNLKQNPGW